MNRITIGRGGDLGWAALAGTIAGTILVITSLLLAPRQEDFSITSERVGEFRYQRGGPRSSAYSTLHGQEVLCGASVIGTYSQCSLGSDGHALRVQFALAPRLFGHVPVAVRAFDADKVVYEVSATTFRQTWLERSLFDALFVTWVCALACYAGLVIRRRLRGENNAKRS